MYYSRNSTLGITLLELMIAMSLSLLLISSVTVIYLTIQKNYQFLSALNELAENSRTASQLLREHIQIAGYSGCVSGVDSALRISGRDDMLATRQASTQSASLILPASNASVLVVGAKPRFKAGDVAVISDCLSAEIFQIKNVIRLASSAQKIVLLKPLNRSYDTSAEVGRWQVFTYLVKKTNRVHRDGAAISALYVRNSDNRLQEWVAGVDAMQVRYAVVIEDQVVTVAASKISDWSSVVGVQIKLLLSSTQDFALHKTSYIYIALRETHS